MKTNTFGKTGLSVSALGFGAAPIGVLETDVQRVGTILNTLLDAGVNLIDTAAAYAGSEEAIGQTVSGRRGDYILVSKCGQKFEDLPGDAWSAELIGATVDRALQRLQTDHLDVMLLHSCDLETLKKGEALAALVDAQEAGKIRYVGYSGDNETVAYAAGLSEIAVVETSINIVDHANISGLLPIAIENNVGVIAKRPIANTAWRSVEKHAGKYQNYVRPYIERFDKMGLSATDLGFTDADWAEIALRFTLSQPGVSTAIIGTTNPENALKNIAAVEKGLLSEDVLAKIRAAFVSAESESGGKWEAKI
ncbi:aldo/keto reductase [bacterium]|nr:MAG: aldo/keto reductase [bacterium]